jgi:hypothetical protein
VPILVVPSLTKVLVIVVTSNGHIALDHFGFRNRLQTSLLPTGIFLSIIWCFAGRTRLASCAADCVSVSAVKYRAFVYAAPQHFAAGNRSVKCRRAASVGVVSPRAATPAKGS